MEKMNLFSKIGEGEDNVMQVESLCLNCQENGCTKLLLLDVPYFKNVVISSFECEHCGNKNEDVQISETIQPLGLFIELKLKNENDLKRMIVRSDAASVIIPQLAFESPGFVRKSEVTSVEGVILDIVTGLNHRIETLKEEKNNDLVAKLEPFCLKVENLCTNFKPFSFIINDPSGNSFIESFLLPEGDLALTKINFVRTYEQNKRLAIYEYSEYDVLQLEEFKKSEKVEIPHDDEFFQLTTKCFNCNNVLNLNIQQVNIPFFKEILLLGYFCENCGYRSNEVKSAGAIEKKGRKFTLQVKNKHDLTRDILKSDFAKLMLPEFEIELSAGTLGSSFCTVENLLTSLQTRFKTLFPFLMGDYADEKSKDRLDYINKHITDAIEGKKEFTLIIDDPSGNSYIQNFCAPDDDPCLIIEDYYRTHEQNEDLGLNDMKTEDY